MGKHFSSDERLALIQAYQASTMGIRSFVLANRVGYSTFQRWLNNVKEGLDVTHCKSPRPATIQDPQTLLKDSLHFMDITI